MAADDLSLFEMPRAWVKPSLEACRGFNTALDVAFYDVQAFVRQLRARGDAVETGAGTGGTNRPKGAELDLDALSNPEGALLVVDPAAAPYVTRFESLPDFLDWHRAATQAPTVVTLTGVGSSALGSAAFAWDVAEALAQPVIAIVPGYGVADAALQAMGGWFGFGLHDALGTKSWLQGALALAAPQLAWVGRKLVGSIPDGGKAATGAPVFEYGGGSSDVLHALLKRIEITRLVGHSKGALSIGNALKGIDARGIEVVTLGCPIATDAAGASYHQFLGLYDALGQLNAWGHPPNRWLPTAHTTNTLLPLCMEVGALAKG